MDSENEKNKNKLLNNWMAVESSAKCCTYIRLFTHAYIGYVSKFEYLSILRKIFKKIQL